MIDQEATIDCWEEVGRGVAWNLGQAGYRVIS